MGPTRHSVPERLHLERVLRDLARSRGRERWAQHCFPWTTSSSTSGKTALPVTWVTPRFEVSDHPEYSFCWGEAWTTKVVNAIMESLWAETAIFLTWDDYGGFYDHVRRRMWTCSASGSGRRCS